MPDRAVGVRAAGVAVRMLQGEDPAQLSTLPLMTNPPVYDARAGAVGNP